MSAIPVSIPRTEGWRSTRSHRSVGHAAAAARTSGRHRAINQAPTHPAKWRLTDRGIAVVMVLAVMILTAALVVIGLTAVRVTGPDNPAGSDQSLQAIP